MCWLALRNLGKAWPRRRDQWRSEPLQVRDWRLTGWGGGCSVYLVSRVRPRSLEMFDMVM